MTPNIKAAIASIADDAWTTIEYTDAIRDEDTGELISSAEVAEVGFTAFASGNTADRVPGRLVVRRIPDFNAPADPNQASLFELWRFHAFFTTSDPEVLNTVAADKTTAHTRSSSRSTPTSRTAPGAPSIRKFHANSAWLVLAVMAFNLTRAAGTLAGGRFARATTGTIRRTPISVPARIASSARRLTLHLPKNWPWETQWTEVFTRTCGPPAQRLPDHPPHRHNKDLDNPTTAVGRSRHAHTRRPATQDHLGAASQPVGGSGLSGQSELPDDRRLGDG